MLQEHKVVSEEANPEEHHSKEEKASTNIDMDILEEPPLIGQGKGLRQEVMHSEEEVLLEKVTKKEEEERIKERGKIWRR